MEGVFYKMEDLNGPEEIGPQAQQDKLRFVYNRSNGNLHPWTTDQALATFWDTPANQPVPPGWRIPSAEDWAEIFPLTRRAGDICNLFGIGTVSSDADNEKKGKHTSYEDDKSKNDWTAWCETIENDPFPGEKTLYLCKRQKKEDGTNLPYGTLFAIKRYGTPYAYRMMWYIWKEDDEKTNSTNGCLIGHHVLRIYRFACPVKPEEDDMSIENFDMDKWHTSKRTSGMVLPITGHIYQGRLIYHGVEACYGTSTTRRDDKGKIANLTVRIKFNYGGPGDANGCYLFIRDDDYSNGRAFQLRLVRDLEYDGRVAGY